MNTSPPLPSPTLVNLRCEHAVNPLGVETPLPRFSWQIDSYERNITQAAYQIQVASTETLLASHTPDIWDSGEVASAQSILVPFGGPTLESTRRYFWRVRVVDSQGRDTGYSAPAFWEMGLRTPSDWLGAQWIGRPDACMIGEAPVLPAPLLRKKFFLPAKLSRARVSISGVGYYELYVNGRKIGPQVLDPVVTQYDQHVGYATFDITRELQEGENTLGVILGNGWYNGSTPGAWQFDTATWRDYPKFLLQMHADLADGEEIVVHSDASWKFSEGPIRLDALRNGEEYDARLAIPDWLDLDFDDTGWKNAMIVPGPGGILISQQMPPTVVIETLEPVENWQIDPNTVVYDFGQNIAGWGQIQAQVPAGMEIKLEYAERLDDARNIDVAHIAMFVRGGVFQTDKYIAKGEGIEIWEPRFTYHGFQYVRMTTTTPPGAPAQESQISIKARFISTDFEAVGQFQCSNTTLNLLQECTQRTYRGNYVGIPTDCPHREKNGWTGDALLAAETGLYNYDASSAYDYWLRMMADTQRPNGAFPGIVPSAGWGYNWGSGPAWDSAYLFIPWHITQFSGDRRVLETHYSGMAQYIQMLTQMTTDGVVRWGLGDWCAPDQDATSPSALVTTAYAYGGSRLMGQVARLLGRNEDAEEFDRAAQTFKQAWRREFLGPDGRCAEDEQTSLSCALYFGLVDAPERPPVVARLLDSIRRADGRLTFGIHGAKWCLRALAEAGEVEAAYALLTQPEYPGWFHWLAQGATTLWEDWKGESSHNHIMYGDVSAWLFAYIAGIQPHPDAPGFEQIVIRPHPVKDLDWAQGSHRSPYGRLESSWKRTEAGALSVQVRVPANTTADIYLPAHGIEDIMESGTPLSETGIRVLTQDAECVRVSVGSGEYDFLLENSAVTAT